MTSERPRAVATATPPTAEKRPRTFSVHGVSLTDDYAWLKDENWQQVLRDPSVLSADIRRYLEAENTYSETVLAGTQGLQKQLVAEMRARIKEDDSTVPSPDGPFEYLTRYREGGQHELIGRQPRGGAEAHIILDGDALAANSKYFRFGGAEHSPDHRLQAWSADLRGSEYFSIHVRSWADSQDAVDLIEQTDGSAVWAADLSAFYYVGLDENHRPLQVFRHQLGTSQADDVLVYQEHDVGWFTHIHRSASGRFCVIAGGDHETSECRLIDLVDPNAKATPGRIPRDRHPLFGRGPRRRTVHPDERGFCHRLQDCRCTFASARARQLARPRSLS